jgi:hypothetical protein
MVNVFAHSSIACSVFLGSLLLITALAVGPAALAQTPTAVSSTYFAATTAVCDNTANIGTSSNASCTASGTPNEFPVWWPDSAVGGSTPAVSLGAEGRGAKETWPDIMNNLACLKRVGSGPGHWEYDLTKHNCSVGNLGTVPAFNWPYTDSYVSAAQASGIDYSFNYLEVPQWAICYNYSGTDLYGGPNGVSCSGASRILTDALCAMNSNPNGTGYCPGPELDPNFGNITYFAQRLVDHYCGFPGTCTTGSDVAIKYYEIVNEPDAVNVAADGVYWQASSFVPDWPTLLTQTVILEKAITSEYLTDHAGNSPTFTGPAFASLDDTHTSTSMCGSTANCGLASSCPSTSGSSLYGFLNSCITYAEQTITARISCPSEPFTCIQRTITPTLTTRRPAGTLQWATCPTPPSNARAII